MQTRNQTSTITKFAYMTFFLLFVPLIGCTAEMQLAAQLEDQIAEEFDLYRVQVISKWDNGEHTLQVYFQKQFRLMESNEEAHQLVEDVALFVAQNHPDLDSVHRIESHYVKDITERNQWLAAKSYDPRILLSNEATQ